MTDYHASLLAITIYRVTVICAGVAFGYMGHRLFLAGLFKPAGDLDANFGGGKRVVLKRAAPGTFFALFGTFIISVALFTKSTASSELSFPVKTSVNQPETPQQTPSQTQSPSLSTQDQPLTKTDSPKPTPTPPPPSARKDVMPVMHQSNTTLMSNDQKAKPEYGMGFGTTEKRIGPNSKSEPNRKSTTSFKLDKSLKSSQTPNSKDNAVNSKSAPATSSATSETAKPATTAK